MKPDPRFVEGLKLFNHGEYFECHEVIEDLWLETPSDDPYRDLYKGVIQAAASIYQFERGIFSGAKGLWLTSRGYLANYAPNALGLDIHLMLDGLEGCLKPLEAWNGVGTPILDRNLVPRLTFEE